jgi:uncharacterized protein
VIHDWWLLPFGFLIGGLGTLIGVGGGFIMMPVLLLVYPQASPETITSISLAVIFFNALSGSWAYSKMKRIDYKSGLVFAAATIPGAILGALTSNYIPRRLFNLFFGLLMIVAAVYMFMRRTARAKGDVEKGEHITTRTLVEKNGTVHTYSFNARIGIVLSVFVGYLSSMLGIGGGIIHVPALIRLLNFPVHIATATSHFILVIMALTGTVVHIATGSFSQGGISQTILLAIGVLIGAQAGARLSQHVRGIWIIRGLAIALAFVGIRILFLAR